MYSTSNTEAHSRITLLDCPGSVCGALRRSTPELSIDVQTSHDFYVAESDVVVLGPDLEHPLATAYTIHQQSAHARIIVLVRNTARTEFEEALFLTASLAHQTTVLSFADEATLVLALRSELEPMDAAWKGRPTRFTERGFDASQALLSAMLESNSMAIVTHTLAGLISGWNRGAERLFGYAAHEAIGRPIDLIVADPERSCLNDWLARIEAGEPIDTVQTMRTTKDGGSIRIVLSLLPVRHANGRVLGVCEVAHDASLHEPIQAQNSHYQDAPAMLLSVQLGSDCVIDCNRKLLRTLGYTKQELVGKAVNELYAKSSREKASSALREFRETGYVENVELLVLRHDATPLEVSLSITGDPRANCYRVSWLDISQRNASDRARLDKEVQFQDFVYSVSHDLRSPLVTLHGFIDLLKLDLEEHETRLPPSALESLQRVEGSVIRMKRLLEGVLSLGRAGVAPESCERVDVNELVREVLHDFESQSVARKIELTLEPLPPAYGEAHRIRLIFYNLISNALEHGAPEGGQIVVGATPRTGGTQYFVRDNGRGVPKKFQAAVFQLFRTLQPKTKGTGVGLAVARRAAEALGGSIEIESTPGNCEFLVWLPGVTSA